MDIKKKKSAKIPEIRKRMIVCWSGTQTPCWDVDSNEQEAETCLAFRKDLIEDVILPVDNFMVRSVKPTERWMALHKLGVGYKGLGRRLRV